MKWNSQQNKALKDVYNWILKFNTNKKIHDQIFYLAGFAGTGKTTLARHFAEGIDGDVCFAAFTGKAALVMRKNGCPGARTIHSLIYKAIVDEESGEVDFILNGESPLSGARLLIVDECSMVDENLGRDLLSFGVPILVLGDPAQLPPVDGAGFFTSREPDVMLTEIHRQAKDNPIIYMATEVRNGRVLDHGTYGDSKVIQKMTKSDLLTPDQVLVGRNVTRHDLNSKMRKLLGHTSESPEKGEKLICLKNDKDLSIFNGGLFTVEGILPQKKGYSTNFLRLVLKSDDEERPNLITKVHKYHFFDEIPKPNWKLLKGSQYFDFAYSLTTHKSQGSQWQNVLVVDESYCFREDRNKWLYTAITRASEKVTILRT